MRERERDQLVAFGAVDRLAELNWPLRPSPVHPTDRQRHQFPTPSRLREGIHVSSVLYTVLYASLYMCCSCTRSIPLLFSFFSAEVEETAGDWNRAGGRKEQGPMASHFDVGNRHGNKEREESPLLPLRGGGVWPVTRTCNPVALGGPSCLPSH